MQTQPALKSPLLVGLASSSSQRERESEREREGEREEELLLLLLKLAWASYEGGELSWCREYGIDDTEDEDN